MREEDAQGGIFHLTLEGGREGGSKSGRAEDIYRDTLLLKIQLIWIKIVLDPFVYV